MEEERKIMKLRITQGKKRFGDALGIDFERFKEVTNTVYNRTKKGRTDETPKTKILQLMINDLDGVTPEELLLLGMSFGALEYMNKSIGFTNVEELNNDMDIREGDPAEIAGDALNKEAFIRDMKNGSHDF